LERQPDNVVHQVLAGTHFGRRAESWHQATGSFHLVIALGGHGLEVVGQVCRWREP
jgi:hypothetical protein